MDHPDRVQLAQAFGQHVRTRLREAGSESVKPRGAWAAELAVTTPWPHPVVTPMSGYRAPSSRWGLSLLAPRAPTVRAAPTARRRCSPAGIGDVLVRVPVVAYVLWCQPDRRPGIAFNTLGLADLSCTWRLRRLAAPVTAR